MTLHRLLVPLGGYTYWWYAAIPNERRGRIHILRVPYVNIQAERIRVPPYADYETETYQRRQAGTYVPSNINGDGLVERFCNTRQNARRWSHEYRTPYRDERNVCPICFEWQQRNVEQIGFPVGEYPANDIRYRQVRTSTGFENEEQWVRHVERRYYGPDR